MTSAHVTFVSAVAALLLTGAPGRGVHAQSAPRDDAVARAAADEMARTMADLKLDNAERPYFVSYTVAEEEEATATASFGSLVGSRQTRGRSLTVEVRVGDYALDNTNFFSMPTTESGLRTFIGVTQLPLDDDYLELRRQIWLATDAAYKQAVEALAGKRAALLNHTRPDSLADFARDDVTHTVDELRPVSLDLAAAQALVRELSRAAVAPDIYGSSVGVTTGNVRTYYMNSEGTTLVRSRPAVTVVANASTQAADGMPLANHLQLSARSMDALPARAELAARVRALCAELDSLRTAPLIERYNGPVLFEGRAGAELFKEQFAPELIAARKAVASNPIMERVAAMLGRSQGGGASLSEKLGARVLPPFLGVVDDPTATTYGAFALVGGYAADDQGVRAHQTHVIDGGILKTFLTSRTPVQGVARSTANFRGGMIAPSNMIVETSEGLSDDAMRERLMALAKARGLPFAIVVRAVGGGSGIDDPASMVQDMMASAMGGAAAKGTNVSRAYRVYADGHEELVRGAQLVGMGADAFKDIVAASSSTTELNGAAASGIGAIILAGDAGPSLSSFVVPSLLFDDLTMVKRPDEHPKPPISAPPPVAPR